MNKQYEMVKEFHEKFGHPNPGKPTKLTPERVAKRTTWMHEELREFNEAEFLVDQADAMIDLAYFVIGTLVEMGVRPDNLFEIVHQANMSKVWPDGSVRRNPDGKIIKPPGWEGPEEKLAAEIISQIPGIIT